MLQAERDQVELLAVDLDSVLAADHQARLVWGYVEQQDWSELENRIKARGSVPGRRAIDPRILFALWHATLQGVGSGREIARLSRTHDAYRWIWGGVGVNYHAERLSRRERTVVRRPAQRQRGGAGGYWCDHAQARGARRGARARQCRGGGLQAARTAVEMLQPRGFGRIRLRRIEGDSGAQVVPFVEASIEPGAQVRTDGLVAYCSLSQLGYKFIRAIHLAPHSLESGCAGADLVRCL